MVIQKRPVCKPADAGVIEVGVIRNTMNDEGVARFSVSLKKSLLRQLDKMTKEKGYDNRSLAVADMIRDHLVEHLQELGDIEAAGTVTLVYDHHHGHVQESLTGLQHKYRDIIVSTLHVHLDHHNCLEVLIRAGQGLRDQIPLRDRLIAAKGVKHGKLTLTTTGEGLPA